MKKMSRDSEMWENIKHTDIHIMGMLEEERME